MSLVVPIDELFSHEDGLLAKANHWEKVELGSVIRILNGYPLKSSLFNNQKGFPIIRIRDLKSNRPETFTTEDFPTEYIVNNGDLLIGMDGDFICYKWTGGKAVLNQRVCKLVNDEKYFDSQFIFYVINGYLDAIQKVTSSVTVKHLSSLDILKIPFPLPPRSEQLRIVAKLDELMEKIDRSRARLERIPKILKRFRQSILSAAVCGNLTQQWRKDEYEWKTLKLGEIGQVSGGLTLNSKRDALPMKMPYLRVANVYANELRLDEIKQIGILDREIKRTLLEDGDLLIVEGNGSLDQIGRVAMWKGEIKGCLHQNHLIKVRFEAVTTSQFVLLFLLSPEGRTQIEDVSTSTTGLNTLSISKISNLNIPLPPTEEQMEIIHRVGQLFSLADKIEARYAKAKAHVDKLSQSLLAKAFRGELVPQYENDEPASLLLERIKEEKRKGTLSKTKQKVKQLAPDPELSMVAEARGKYSKSKK